MNTLLIDIGNTRIKWARWNGERFAARHAAAHGGWDEADYGRRLFGARGGVTAVLVASVASRRADDLLRLAARRSGARLKFLRVTRSGGGVRVGYLEPWRLGVDRFAAVVGAHRLFPRLPVLVIGVGTAMTLDLVGADGRHHGGAIVPAPDLMVQTLLTRTAGIRRRARGGASEALGLFARSTRAGVVQGASHAAAALIDRAVQDARAITARAPLVILSGGDAEAVRCLVRSPCATVADLVLRGLAVLAGGD